MDSNSATVVGKKRSASTISISSATSSAPVSVSSTTKAQSKDDTEKEVDNADHRLEKKEARSRSSISLLRSTLNDNEEGKLQLAGIANLLADYKRKIVSLEKKCEGQKDKLKKLQQKYSDKKQLELDSEAKDILEKFGGDCATTRAKLNRVMQSLQWDSTRRIENMRRTNELKEQRKAKNPIWRDLSFLLNKAAKSRDQIKKKNGAVTPKVVSKSDTANGNDSGDENENVPEDVALLRQQGAVFAAAASEARPQPQQGAARKKSRPNKN
mmetsp:Transcript_11332/g.18449  ORF Transcript_11332/g.18449 Transcript_11332/m.18449 type:complete len:269 (+) Transcript_11332:75-881(+)